MITTKLLLAGAAALTLGMAGPAFAQSAGSNVTGAAGDHSNTSNATTQVAVALNSTKNSLSNETTNLTRNSTENVSFSLTNNSQRNGNVHLVADQSLDQSVSKIAPVYFTGKESNYANAGNSVSGSAFAAYSGILNQGWNTGINSNAAGATNIAAQGSTTFTTR